MGGDAPQYNNTNESVDSQLQAYIKNLPALVNASAANLAPIDNAQLALAQQNAPSWGQLQVDLANQQGVPLAEANARAEAAANAVKSGQDLATLQGSGGDLVRYADLLARSIDPEYYSTRTNLARQGNALLDSYNMTGLSPTERAEIERSLARQNLATGTYGLPSQINTLTNANQFGSALQNKRNNLAGSLGAVAGITPAFRSGFDPIQTALGRPSVATGLAGSQFAGVQQPQFGAAGLNQGNMLFGGINNTANSAMQANASMFGANRNNNALGAFGAITGGLGNLGGMFNFTKTL